VTANRVAGRAGRLDRDRIIEATVALSREADEHALSFRRLGAQLDVDPTAIYRHFSSKDELVAAALDTLWVGAAKMVPPALPWRSRLHTIAHVFFQVVIDHPGLGVDAYRLSTNGPGERTAVDLVIGCLAEAGLAEDDVISHYALFSTTVLAQASAHATQSLSGSVTTELADQSWISDLATTPLDQFPSLHRYVERLAALDHTAVFELSLGVVLDAIAAAGRRDSR
jgi:AcrR family transcriptional regulator